MAKRDILHLLSDGHEGCTDDIEIALGLSRTTIGIQIKKAYVQGLLQRRWDGRQFWYSITERGLRRIDYWNMLEAEAASEGWT